MNPSILKRNIANVKARVTESANSCGRVPSDISIIAVSKYIDADATRQLVEAGITTLGESRPQVLQQKAEALSDLTIDWHLIGHLQRNKVEKTLEHVKLIHSIDSTRLLMEINRCAAQKQLAVDGLLQVNISEESNKHGFTAPEIEPLILELDQYPNVCIKGLMGMAGLGISEQETAKQFAQLGKLRDQLQRQLPADSTTQLDILSMGMSGDFHLAIQNGATHIRIGSLFFQET